MAGGEVGLASCACCWRGAGWLECPRLFSCDWEPRVPFRKLAICFCTEAGELRMSRMTSAAESSLLTRRWSRTLRGSGAGVEGGGGGGVVLNLFFFLFLLCLGAELTGGGGLFFPMLLGAVTCFSKKRIYISIMVRDCKHMVQIKTRRGKTHQSFMTVSDQKKMKPGLLSTNFSGI